MAANRAFANEEELAKIGDIRADLASEIKALADAGYDFAHTTGDIFFTRVLRGNAGDVKKSVAWLRECYETRKKYGMDEIAMQCKDIPLITAKIPFLNEFAQIKHVYFEFNEETTFSPEGDILGICGSAEGWNAEFYAAVKDFGYDKYIKAMLTWYEVLMITLDKQSREKGSMAKFMMVTDVKNYCWPPKDFADVDKTFTNEVFPKVGAELIAKNGMVLIQVNKSVRYMIKIVSPFLPASVTDSFKMTTSKFMEEPEIVSLCGVEPLRFVLAKRSGEMSGDDDSMKGTKEIILKGNNLERAVVVQAGQTVSWTFRMATAKEIGEAGGRSMMGKIMDSVHEATDVTFEVCASWDQEPGESWVDETYALMKNIVAAKSVDGNSGEISGSIEAEKNGLVMLRWGNFNYFAKAGRVRMLASFEIKVSE